MKSVKVKIAKKYQKELTTHINWYVGALTDIEQKILVLGGIRAYDKYGNLYFDAVAERNKLCKNDVNLIAACQKVYDMFIDNTSKTFTATFLGGRNKGDKSKMGRKSNKKLSEKELAEKNQKKEEKEKSIVLLEKNGILPFNFNEVSNKQYNYSLITVIHAKLTSYATQIVSTKADYDAIKKKLIQYEENLIKQFSLDTIEKFKSFCDLCDLHNHRINYKFISYLQNNTSLYTEKGYWMDTKGNKHRYSMKREIVEAINNNPSLIQFFIKTTTQDVEKYIELVHKFKNKKEIPSYTMFNEDTFKIALGNNYIPFSLNVVNNQMVWQINLPDGNKYQFVANYIRKDNNPKNGNGYYKGKNHYFENLKITPEVCIEDQKDKNDKVIGKKEISTGNYCIEFSINGKQDFKGIFKEPNIISKNGNLYVQLPITVKSEEVKNLEKIRDRIRWYFNTSYPTIGNINKRKTTQVKTSKKSSKNDKITSISDCKTLLGHDVNILGVDLGLRGIAIAHMSHDGKTEKVISDDYVKGDLVERLQLKEINTKIMQKN